MEKFSHEDPHFLSVPNRELADRALNTGEMTAHSGGMN